MWKSFAECLPKEGCGLLIKFDPKNKDIDIDWEVDDKLYYGYILTNSIDGIYIIAKIDKMNIIPVGWKAHKYFDNDEIFWIYDSSFKIQQED